MTSSLNALMSPRPRLFRRRFGSAESALLSPAKKSAVRYGATQNRSANNLPGYRGRSECHNRQTGNDLCNSMRDDSTSSTHDATRKSRPFAATRDRKPPLSSTTHLTANSVQFLSFLQIATGNAICFWVNSALHVVHAICFAWVT